MVYSSDLYPAHRSTGNKNKPFERETIFDFEIRLSNGDEYTIEKGFFTDLGTVPRFLWGLISPWGRDELAFIVHDWLLENYSHKYEREFIDLQMCEFQKLVEVSPLRTQVMHKGVRKFGWLHTIIQKIHGKKNQY